MKNKRFLAFTFLLLAILSCFCFFSLPDDEYKSYKLGERRSWEYENVIVRYEKLDFMADLENNKIILSEEYKGEYNYEIYLPPKLISQNIEDISSVGKLFDKENRHYLCFSYDCISKEVFIIKDAIGIPIYNQPDDHGILELKEIEDIGVLEENRVIVKIFFGLIFCISMTITIFFSKEEWLP